MEKKKQKKKTACNVLYTYTYSTPPPFNCGEQIVRQYMVGWENLSIIAPQQTNKIVPVRKAGAEKRRRNDITTSRNGFISFHRSRY